MIQEKKKRRARVKRVHLLHDELAALEVYAEACGCSVERVLSLMVLFYVGEPGSFLRAVEERTLLRVSRVSEVKSG